MKDLKNALVLFLFTSVVTGLFYPLAITLGGSLFFPHQAAGSPALRAGETMPVGSELLGQDFISPAFFHGRPSATPASAYNPQLSAGSNLAASNPALAEAAKTRLAALLAANPDQQEPVPADLLTASASGLDPDVSLVAARWQVPRVARARGLDPATLFSLIDTLAKRRIFGFLGEPRVNVLQLNLALERQKTAKG